MLWMRRDNQDGQYLPPRALATNCGTGNRGWPLVLKMLLHYSQFIVCPAALFLAIDVWKEVAFGVYPKLCRIPRRPHKSDSVQQRGAGRFGTRVLRLNYSSPDDKRLCKNQQNTAFYNKHAEYPLHWETADETHLCDRNTFLCWNSLDLLSNF